MRSWKNGSRLFANVKKRYFDLTFIDDSMINEKWNNVVGLAPMDGVTDAAFRQIVDIYGKPDVLFTEFLSVEGYLRAPKKLSHVLDKHETNTLTIVQLHGAIPEHFSKVIPQILDRGFDGIDINMGCPDRAVMKKGGGAALMKDQERALGIIDASSLAIEKWKETHNTQKRITLSIKIRSGLEESIVETWIIPFLQKKLDFITIHGRTVKQLFSGAVDWETIAYCKTLAKSSGIGIWGNGDISSRKDAMDHITKYKLDGILIGRRAFGNPWLFQDKVPSPKERFLVMIAHARLYHAFWPDMDFSPMRKHFTWYCKGIHKGNELKDKLMKVSNMNELMQEIDIYRNCILGHEMV